MHGKAVALFDFARENENELPLIEGQVIWVSYRHGQGWLVAEDPKTRESGLVPEEYVRLFRDIEGGWSSLSGELDAAQVSGEEASPDEPGGTPTGEENDGERTITTGIGGVGAGDKEKEKEKEKSKVIVSSFSTSSQDLNPYPHPLLGTQTGQPPPQVVHYGSQNATPVMSPVLAATAGKKGVVEGSAVRKEEGGER